MRREPMKPTKKNTRTKKLKLKSGLKAGSKSVE
jgi:hypothetical protein